MALKSRRAPGKSQEPSAGRVVSTHFKVDNKLPSV